ncbi:hypothetical protein [Ekhidna sp.]|uniref:hypothetical protein n=1 Tax=Ekhidna sp. TaxID=2608089 RepID=UPI003B511F42
MKNLTKTLKSILAMVLVFLFTASAIVSCDVKKQAEGNEDETEEASEATETEEAAESDEHPSGEHPSDGGEHPSDGEHPSEDEADSTSTDS